MKRTILSLVMAMAVMVMTAQTDFRHISFAEALQAAKSEKKLVFVDFYTTWCGPCKRMARDVFPQQALGEYMNSKFVCVKFDAEKEEAELVEKCGVDSYPTFIVFDTDGNEKARLIGSNSAAGFMTDLDMKIDPEKNPEKIKARYDAGERTAGLIKTYAAQISAELRTNRRNADLQKKLDEVIDGYYSSLTDAQRIKSENFFIYSDYVDNTADEKMQFLYNNRGKIAKTDRAEADTILVKAYREQIRGCLYFRPVYDAAQVAVYKRQFNALGLNAGGKFDGCFAMLEAYASGNYDKYVDEVEKNVKGLDESMAATVMFGMGNALVDAPQETKTKAAKFLRSRLAEMSSKNISYMGMTIGKLEGTEGN